MGEIRWPPNSMLRIFRGYHSLRGIKNSTKKKKRSGLPTWELADYRKIPLVIPGLIQLRKVFQEGL